MKAVVDSSVVVKWITQEGEDWTEQADLILERASEGELELIAPDFMKYEIGNALRYKKIAEDEKLECLRQFYDLPVRFYPLSVRRAVRAFEIASQTNITFYDAVFVELAERVGGFLITANPKHQKKFGGVKVIALKDYS